MRTITLNCLYSKSISWRGSRSSPVSMFSCWILKMLAKLCAFKWQTYSLQLIKNVTLISWWEYTLFSLYTDTENLFCSNFYYYFLSMPLYTYNTTECCKTIYPVKSIFNSRKLLSPVWLFSLKLPQFISLQISFFLVHLVIFSCQLDFLVLVSS